MMLAQEYTRSAPARSSDFSTSRHEGPLIAQFAATNATDFVRASTLISPWVNGVDLNCGCPQSWAIKEGIGCALLAPRNRELVASIVRAARLALGGGKSVSVKIRVSKDLRETVQLLRAVEQAGADYVTVHARTREQRSSTPPIYAALPTVMAATSLPVVFNGDVDSVATAAEVHAKYGVQGVMSARPLQENPALFAGFESTPRECVERFVRFAVRDGLRFELVVRHLVDMMGGLASKKERAQIMGCTDLIELIDWLEEKGFIGPSRDA